MSYRTVEIGKSAEIHIKEGQLEVTSEDGLALIPVEDISLERYSKTGVSFTEGI